MISKDFLDKLVATLFELVDDSVVQGILVLFQPACDVVGHLRVKLKRQFEMVHRVRTSTRQTCKSYSSGVMGNSEVSFLLTGLGGLGLDEAVGLAQVVVVQLVGEGLVSGLGEHRLFLKDGQDTHGLLFTNEK